MKKALMGASAAAVVVLAPLCMPSAQARAGDPCVSITDPAAHQACIDQFLRNDPARRDQGNNCQSSPLYGQEGQICRDFWTRKSNSRDSLEASAFSQCGPGAGRTAAVNSRPGFTAG